MKIAIIDTGIDTSHRKIDSTRVTGIALTCENGAWQEKDDFSDRMGHGTACAAIIHKHIPDADLVAVKIFTEGKLTKEDALIEALQWIDRQNDIQLVNISLGSSGAANDRLASICEKLFRKGVILVAACDNDINQRDYPAAFPSVIGVLGGQIKNHKQYGLSDEGYFVAKGSIQRIASVEGKDIIATGTSYATPHLTGIIACMLKEANGSSSIDEILKKLIANADRSIKPMQFTGIMSFFRKPSILNAGTDTKAEQMLTFTKKLGWIERIAIFPASEKEMKQFLDFPHLTIPKVTLLIDYPRTFSSFRVHEQKPFLRKLPTDEEFDTFDTLVVGYYHDSLWEGNISFGNKLIDKCLEKGKSFFVYDQRAYSYITNRVKDLGISQLPNIYSPEVTQEMYEEIKPFEFLPNVGCPVLMVIGTGNKQGKFTTQLRLKEILGQEGYRVGHIATEPQGELFGANSVFPCGYMRSIHLESAQLTVYLRNLIKGIAYYTQPHIILSGTQGAVMPYNPISPFPAMGMVESIALLYGLLPDLIVCAINPFDPIDIIKKSTLLARLYSKCKIAFFVITPWNKNSDNPEKELTAKQLQDRINYYQQELGKPVFNIMDTSNNKAIIRSIEEICS